MSDDSDRKIESDRDVLEHIRTLLLDLTETIQAIADAVDGAKDQVAPMLVQLASHPMARMLGLGGSK